MIYVLSQLWDFEENKWSPPEVMSRELSLDDFDYAKTVSLIEWQKRMGNLALGRHNEELPWLERFLIGWKVGESWTWDEKEFCLTIGMN